MNPTKIIFSIFLFSFLSFNATAQDILDQTFDQIVDQVVDPDIAQRGEDLLNDFMEGLRIQDTEESIRAILPYLHKTLKTEDGQDITRDVRLYSFKKAHRGAKRYHFPVKLTLIRKVFLRRDLGEEGQEYDFFIAKVPEYSGYPAPVKIFHNKKTDKLTVSYIGSI